MRVWSKEFNGKIAYSTTISKKIDGKYNNMYINVQFPKGTIVENGQEIIVNEGFWSYYTDKNELAHPIVVIMGYQLEDEGEINIIEGYDKDELPF